MAFSRAVSRSLNWPRCVPFQESVVGNTAWPRCAPFQVRCCSHGREAITQDRRAHAALRSSTLPIRAEQIQHMLPQFPIISGDEVCFPVLESSQPPRKQVDRASAVANSSQLPKQLLDSSSSHRDVPGKLVDDSRSLAAHLLDDLDRSLMPDVSEELLKSFVVPGSHDIAARLLQNVEVQLMLSKNRAAQRRRGASLPVRKRVSLAKPIITDRMVAQFGSTENIVALVCRFVRVARDVAATQIREEKVDVVRAAVQDLCASQPFSDREIDAIVDVVSDAQQSNVDQDRSYSATDVIRFLSFENVWQKLNAEQRWLVTSEHQVLKMTGAGAAEGMKAFRAYWQRLNDNEQDATKANLCSLAQCDQQAQFKH